MANLILIRDLCEKRKMSIRELAAKIGRNECSIQSAMRRGSTNTTTLELIANELGVPAGIFFDGFSTDSKAIDLQKEIEHLKMILEEKERTIQILLSNRK
ncbi:MAG: helix-turn-helix transcriptional regulator [Duncaniella sp.]|nr:helix-turn-helix transcriptional regulator [Duncaniella sp.]